MSAIAFGDGGTPDASGINPDLHFGCAKVLMKPLHAGDGDEWWLATW